ncbi:MAG: DUF2164 domain-containing protein [Bacilli bacterium]
MIPIKIGREDKMLLVEDLQEYLLDQLSESIGNVAAEGIFDFVSDLVGPYVYNQAIADARNVVEQQMERTEDDLNVLEKPLVQRRRP